MGRLLGHRPSPAMVVALVALIVAMAGTSYAAIELPANSVGTKQLRKNAVTSRKVKDRSLRRVDFAAGQLPRGPQGPAGARGPAGAQGPAGPPGAAGTNAFGSLTYVATDAIANPASSQSTGAVTCPAGQHPTGGGVLSESLVAGEQSVNSSSPFASSGVPGAAPDSWGAAVDNTSASPLTFVVYAVCAPAAQVTPPAAAAAQSRASDYSAKRARATK